MIDVSQLGWALAHWLGFQEKIGRDFMMNEDAMKYPLSDYLANHGEIPISTIELERAHPDFSKRLIDVIISTPSVNNANGNNQIINAFELKVAKAATGNTSEKERIFNDLIRLHLVKKYAAGKCYFIISGKSRYFLQSFHNLTTRGKLTPYYSKWLSFQAGASTTFNVSTEIDPEYRDIYQAFLDDYQNAANTLQLPTQMTTTCEFITPLNTQVVPYMTGVWSVH